MSIDQPADHPEVSHHWHPPPLRWRVIAIVAALTLAAMLAVLDAWDLWPFANRIEITDNAYVRGRTTVIAPQVSGYVAAVLVSDYARVKAGQVLARIDDSTYRARVEQARANLAAAQASLANNQQARASGDASLLSQNATLVRAQADMMRADELVKDGSVSVRERDETKAALAQARAQTEIARQNIRTIDVGRGGLEAQVAAAQAALRSAEIDLEHTAIMAPEAGQVSEVGVRLGQYVTNGTQLMSLVPSERWVIANYKEAQTAHMAPGQAASFRVDALAGAKFSGRVEQLSPAAGSEFSVLKPDNATGNFVKVPQRIGVRIAIDPNQPDFARLRPGMSVISRIDTNGGP
ncbi:MAG TPA: HlyD family secretion protein [Rhizomicrobium sp.]|nr:HlyD family secretion protein [Rhizomicrobium sp.]